MNRSDTTRDLFMLKGALSKKGYDWWWHNFTGYNRSTGEARAFFIEYFVCNPALGADTAVLGQDPYNKERGIKPSYALIKVGHWGKGAQQIHNFYSLKDFHYNPKVLDLKIAGCSLTETSMQGSCSLSQEEAACHPEYLSGWGSMSWNLQIDKQIAFNVGYGASALFRKLNTFEMFWHAEGIKTQYSGELILNNEVYDVIPERSYGYSDKNWGADFTSPWLWISSCNLKSLKTGKALLNSALEIGGGNPKVYGLSLGRKLLGCLYYEGEMYEYNFAKFWTGSNIDFAFEEQEELNTWTLEARNAHSRMEVLVHCKKDEMLLVNYESPKGEKLHNRLWNGGTGYGEIKLYSRKDNALIDHLALYNAGCEYGEYAR